MGIGREVGAICGTRIESPSGDEAVAAMRLALVPLYREIGLRV